MYVSPKIHKKLDSIAGHPANSDCGTPMEKSKVFRSLFKVSDLFC